MFLHTAAEGYSGCVFVHASRKTDSILRGDTLLWMFVALSNNKKAVPG